MSRNYSARVMRFRACVYGARIDAAEHGPQCPGEGCKVRGCGAITAGCQVLLLRLSDGMDAKGIVSIPRKTLAEELGCAPARITEWVDMAMRHGFLSRVRRGRPGTTAVYQGLHVAPKVRERVPSHLVRKPGPVLVRERVPQIDGQRYASAGSQVEETSAGIEQARSAPSPRRGSYEETKGDRAPSSSTGCQFHPWQRCPEDCRNHPQTGRASA